MDADPDLARLDRCLAQLSDHFDSVQIIATCHKGTHTIVADRGTGNWYSRYGAMVQWVRREDARTLVNEQPTHPDDYQT